MNPIEYVCIMYISPIFITIKNSLLQSPGTESTDTRFGSRVKRKVYESVRKIPEQAKNRISQSVRMIKIESYDKPHPNRHTTQNKL